MDELRPSLTHGPGLEPCAATVCEKQRTAHVHSVWLTLRLLLQGIFVFGVVGVGAEWRSVPFLCLTFDHLSRRMFEVATCG